MAPTAVVVLLSIAQLASGSAPPTSLVQMKQVVKQVVKQADEVADKVTDAAPPAKDPAYRLIAPLGKEATANELQDHAARERSQGITAVQLTDLERHFEQPGYKTFTKLQQCEGADRMSPRLHNYGPTYAAYLNALKAAVPKPLVAEVGILKGSGLAMWQNLFPESSIYGFDIDTTVYLRNRQHLQSHGFKDEKVQVHTMDQLAKNNTQLIQHAFGSLKANMVIDDGDHCPEAAWKTFDSMFSSLGDAFVYFYEDINVKKGYCWTPEQVAAFKAHMRTACPTCIVDERGPSGKKAESMIVVSRGLRAVRVD